MELYTQVSYELSRHVTLRYSTSFGRSTKLFAKNIRADVFAVYGLVRIADEIVDTYKGTDQAQRLSALERDVMQAIETSYSANPIVHAFALTVGRYSIDTSFIRAFFASMELDLQPQTYTHSLYETYIYGSAEVIGLMCLAIFTDGNQLHFDKLKKGARALGAAYQKVNFLRDIASDYSERHRYYFPEGSFDTFNDSLKEGIIKDIRNDLHTAESYIKKLPRTARRAVSLSYAYYRELLNILDATPAETIKAQRIRVPNFKKLLLFYGTSLQHLQKGSR